ncbi:hypothetical protein GT50_02825 [Geobacillus stearothermophilus 10]|nr:hypothetical protein GT50_02825 [Geobacillus stearothermophilus 10]
MKRHKNDLAAVIMEPVVLASMVILPDNDFIQTVRQICTEHGIVLIFDEVMTGIRLGLGGAQEYLGVIPDLATYSKILGCGFPIAALAGRKDLMEHLSPTGRAEASGTNTGRVLSVLGAYKVLSYLKDHPEVYAHVRELNYLLVNGIRELFLRYGVKGYVEGIGGRISIHFGTEKRLRNYRQVVETWNKNYHLKCYQKAFEKKLYAFLLPLGPCPEPISLSYAHQKADVEETLNIFESILRCIPYESQ